MGDTALVLSTLSNMNLPALTHLNGEKVEWGDPWGDVAEPVDQVTPAAKDEVMVPLGVVRGGQVVGMSASFLEEVDEEQLEEMMKQTWTSKTSETPGWGTKSKLTKDAHRLMQYLKDQDDEWGLQRVVWTKDRFDDVTEHDMNLMDLRVYGPFENAEVGKEWDRVIFSRYHNGDMTTNQMGLLSGSLDTIEMPSDRIVVYSEPGKPPDVRLR